MFSTRVLLIAALTLSSSMAMADPVVRFKNRTGATIKHILVKPPADSEFGSDILDGVILDGRTRAIDLLDPEQCRVDIRYIDEHGRVEDIHRVNACNGYVELH